MLSCFDKRRWGCVPTTSDAYKQELARDTAVSTPGKAPASLPRHVPSFTEVMEENNKRDEEFDAIYGYTRWPREHVAL